MQKSQRAEGKGAWKVVPKDSCEVYKDRRKRQAVNNRRDEDDAKMRKSDSHRTPSRNKKSQKRNDDKKSRKEAVKKTRRRRKLNQRFSAGFIITFTLIHIKKSILYKLSSS